MSRYASHAQFLMPETNIGNSIPKSHLSSVLLPPNSPKSRRSNHTKYDINAHNDLIRFVLMVRSLEWLGLIRGNIGSNLPIEEIILRRRISIIILVPRCSWLRSIIHDIEIHSVNNMLCSMVRTILFGTIRHFVNLKKCSDKVLYRFPSAHGSSDDIIRTVLDIEIPILQGNQRYFLIVCLSCPSR